MDKVIKQLRRAREAKGMELKEVEEVTKIRSRYLQALEEENYNVLPGGVYTVGFLRSYARFLDLDAESIVSSFRMEVTAMELETAFDDTLKATNRRLRSQWFIERIRHLFGGELGATFKL